VEHANSAASTQTSRVIKASREALYRAFTDPTALEAWQAPEGMTGKVHWEDEDPNPNNDRGRS
jgi:uncharacterized protein YndB with AHSA1/START domain